tara:strand:+ start:358 stop:708 length:351 start_codon:yes stop_codon:yes gene_type:complete
MEVTGIIKLINDTKEYGEKGFRKREMVIRTNEQYPQDILLEFIQDKTSLLDKHQVGDKVKININLRGKEWTNDKGEVKYFNSIQGWRIEELEESDDDVVSTGNPPPPVNQPDDLPF